MKPLPELKRIKLEVPSISTLDHDLAVKSANLLGYRELRIVDRQSILQIQAIEALNKLGIEALDPVSVEAYKEALKEKSNRFWARTNRFMELMDWYLTPIRRFQEKIPEFALSRAVEIAEELKIGGDEFKNECGFYVCALKTENEVYPDPFLVISENSDRSYWANDRSLPWRIYLDVWDEPGFEGRRVK